MRWIEGFVFALCLSPVSVFADWVDLPTVGQTKTVEPDPDPEPQKPHYVQTNCPGGVCPVPLRSRSVTRSRTVVRAPVVQAPSVVRSVPVVSYSSTGSSYGSSGSSVSNYQRRWYNHDGLTLRQHAEHVHGYSTAGMSDAEVAAANDHYHDQYGGSHHATGTVVSTGYTVMRSVRRFKRRFGAFGLQRSPWYFGKFLGR